MTLIEPNKTEEEIKSLKNIAKVVYALQATTYVLGISFFLAPLLAYWKRRQAHGTWLESHFRWQINSFWFSLAGIVLGVLVLSTPVGIMILIATSMWFVFRIVQGWTRLSRGQAIMSSRAR